MLWRRRPRRSSVFAAAASLSTIVAIWHIAHAATFAAGATGSTHHASLMQQRMVREPWHDLKIRRAAMSRPELDEFLEERESDLLSGETFSRRSLFTFESESPNAQVFIFIAALLAVSGLFGLFFNGIGAIALLTTPSAKPGMDTQQGLLIEVLGLLLGGAGFIALRDGRTRTIRRLDAELAFGSLYYEPTDGIGVPVQLLDGYNRSKSGQYKMRRRFLVLFGAREEVADALRLAAVYRRRWLTSGVTVVAVCEDGLPVGIPRGSWLAKSSQTAKWIRRRNSLRAIDQETNQDFQDAKDAKQNAANSYKADPDIGDASASWMLLGKSGRVRGLGDGYPSFDEIVGYVGVEENLSILPTRAPIDQARSGTIEDVLAVHDLFYDALKDGNYDKMTPLWIPDDAAKAETEAQRKGRVPWDNILSDKAAVLDVVDADVVFDFSKSSGALDLETAMVTSVEVCKGEGGFLNEGGPDGKGTLLATKKFVKDGNDWRIISHQTIPYCRNTLATQSLRCNCNGCQLLKPQ